MRHEDNSYFRTCFFVQLSNILLQNTAPDTLLQETIMPIAKNMPEEQNQHTLTRYPRSSHTILPSSVFSALAVTLGK